MAIRQIVFASGNAGKAREICALFKELFGSDVELLLQGQLGVESVEETGVTFRDNALLKARHAAAVTGLPALADDSGIEVDALNGAPGVYSSRFAGVDASDQDNVEKLLSDLRDTPVAKRTARFRCVLVYVRDPADPAPLVADGVWEGAIAGQQSGADGFGYDPIFVDADSGMTAAELSPEQKNARSHRGKALLQLRSQLSTAGL